MFFVIDKSKILSYIVAICTVVILFVAATGIKNDSSSQNSVMTYTNNLDMNALNIETNTIRNVII